MRGRRAWALGLLVAGGIAGCVAWVRPTADRDGQGATVFHHQRHLRRQLDCADCHAGTSGVPGAADMPDPAFCLECHEGGAQARKASDVFVRGYAARPAAARYEKSPSYADVRFSHKTHVGKGRIDCATCHPEASRGALAMPAGRMPMDTCMACHEERNAPNDCATCHEHLSPEQPPPDHTPGWVQRHGPLWRVAGEGALAREQRCDLCHTRSSCDSCHASQPPRDHGVAFRNSTHGLAASMDRSRCITCHRVDSCERCHSQEPPRSHRAGFGSPANRHCLGCHLPVGSEGCVVCHKGTPSHDLAPVKPPLTFHATANSPGECLACHRRVSHPVGSDDCNACHR